MTGGNFNLVVRTKRWVKFFLNYVNEKLHGLDFSMVYVGDIQRNTAEFHGYSMTDAGDMKRMLQAIPVNPADAAFLDIGCGKGMCMKCAAESGYRKVAGLDLDRHLLDIAPADASLSESSAQASATEESASEAPAEESTSSESSAEATPAPQDTEGGKTLVVYYLATGNTEEAANYIARRPAVTCSSSSPPNRIHRRIWTGPTATVASSTSTTTRTPATLSSWRTPWKTGRNM